MWEKVVVKRVKWKVEKMRETWWYWVVLGCYSYGQWGCETCKKKVGPVNVGLERINMRRSVVGVGTHLRSEWGHCNYVHWEDLRLGTCWRKICLTGLLFLFLFFFFFQENNKICLTATGGAFYFCFFFFKKITRYASLPLVGPFFLFFFKKI